METGIERFFHHYYFFLDLPGLDIAPDLDFSILHSRYKVGFFLLFLTVNFEIILDLQVKK